MVEPTIYRSRKNYGGRDTFRQVIWPVGKDGRRTRGERHCYIEQDDDGRDSKGRIMLELVDHQPGSGAPWEMWVNPDAPGGSLEKKAETQTDRRKNGIP